MSNNSTRPQDEINKHGMPSECRACGSSELVSLSELPDPICEDCGFVLSDDATIPSGLSDRDDSDQDSVDWSEYHSVSDSTEQQVASALEQAEELGQSLELSLSAREQAAEIYADAAIEGITNGRSMPVIVAAAVCLATRQVNKPRPCDRIADAAEINSGRLKHGIRLFQRSLGYEPAANEPYEYLRFLCCELDLPVEIENQARQLLEELNGAFRNKGKHPVGIASAALYITANGSITQRQVASVAGITQETIRVRLRDLREARGEQ